MRNNVILLNTNNSIVVSMIDFGASLSGFEFQFHSIQFCHSVMSNSLQPHGLQLDSLPCPSLIPGVYSYSSTLSQWCHPTISSSVIPFSSHLQSFPASGSFPMSQFSTSVPLLTSNLTLDKLLTLCAEIILCSNLTPLSFLSLWKTCISPSLTDWQEMRWVLASEVFPEKMSVQLGQDWYEWSIFSSSYYSSPES